MHRSFFYWVFLLIFGVIFVIQAGGCLGGDKVYKRQKTLYQSVKIYNERLRWQQYDVASKFVDSDSQTQFMEYYEGLRSSLNITDVKMVSAELDQDNPDKGKASVYITYFQLPGTSLKRELQRQNWTYDVDEERWLINLPDLDKK